MLRDTGERVENRSVVSDLSLTTGEPESIKIYTGGIIHNHVDCVLIVLSRHRLGLAIAPANTRFLGPVGLSGLICDSILLRALISVWASSIACNARKRFLASAAFVA